MTTSYFQPTFEAMDTDTLRMWLRQAQIQLPLTTGAAYDIIAEGIKAAASELLVRYREESKRRA
jgi:hypothetical protein